MSGNSNDYLITTLRFASILIFPVFLGVAMVREELIGLILGSKWLDITGLFAIIVVTVPLRIIAYVVSPALLAAGGARINMTNAFFTLVFLTVAIFALLPMGLAGVAVAWSLASICIFGLTLVRGGRLLGISLKRFLQSIAPALAASLAMCGVLFLAELSLPGLDGVWGLYKIPLGAVVYLVLFRVLFPERTRELLHVTTRLVGRRGV